MAEPRHLVKLKIAYKFDDFDPSEVKEWAGLWSSVSININQQQLYEDLPVTYDKNEDKKYFDAVFCFWIKKYIKVNLFYGPEKIATCQVRLADILANPVRVKLIYDTENAEALKLSENLNFVTLELSTKNRRQKNVNFVTHIDLSNKLIKPDKYFFKLRKINKETQEKETVFQSVFKKFNGKNSLEWSAQSYNLDKLAGNDLGRSVCIELCSKKSIKGSGYFNFEREHGEQDKKVPLCSKSQIFGDTFGLVTLKDLKIREKFNFMDYLTRGLKIIPVYAVDFTSSNLPLSDPSSLHRVKQDTSVYLKAIRSLSYIMGQYSEDERAMLWGFGAVLNNKISHCFSCSFDVTKPFVHRYEEVKEQYLECLDAVSFGKIKRVSEVVKVAAEYAKHVGANRYVVAFVLTTDKDFDIEETTREICKSSTLPISFIFVGIGQGSFHHLNYFSPNKSQYWGFFRKYRKNFDVVKFDNIVRSAGRYYKMYFNENCLKEIPLQYLNYCKMKKIIPPRTSEPALTAKKENFVQPLNQTAPAEVLAEENPNPAEDFNRDMIENEQKVDADEEQIENVKDMNETDDAEETALEVESKENRERMMSHLRRLSTLFYEGEAIEIDIGPAVVEKEENVASFVPVVMTHENSVGRISFVEREEQLDDHVVGVESQAEKEAEMREQESKDEVESSVDNKDVEEGDMENEVVSAIRGEEEREKTQTVSTMTSDVNTELLSDKDTDLDDFSDEELEDSKNTHSDESLHKKQKKVLN